MDYELRTLGPDDDADQVRAFVAAIQRGFLQSRPTEETQQRWLGNMRGDGALLRGAYRPATDGPELDGDDPVATFASYTGRITMPDLTPLANRMITDVTVRASHRRRGLLRRLMTAELEQAHAERLPIASLTVSEATIYGRFGFGVIGFQPRAELDVSPGFALRVVPSGTVEEVNPRHLWPVASEIFERFHAGQSGSVGWPTHYRDWLTGAWNYEENAEDRKLRALVHRDDDGTPDGFCTFFGDGEGQEPATVTSPDLLALTPDAYLGLINHLASTDLINRVVVRRAWPEDPLPWALVDSRRYRIAQRSDLTWARILDPLVCLGTAAWRGDAQFGIGVTDPMGFAAGTFAVTVTGDAVEVERSDRPADLHLDVDTLSSVLFGATSITSLTAAGRLTGAPAALAALTEVARHTPTPYSVAAF